MFDVFQQNFLCHCEQSVIKFIVVTSLNLNGKLGYILCGVCISFIGTW